MKKFRITLSSTSMFKMVYSAANKTDAEFLAKKSWPKLDIVETEELPTTYVPAIDVVFTAIENGTQVVVQANGNNIGSMNKATFDKLFKQRG